MLFLPLFCVMRKVVNLLFLCLWGVLLCALPLAKISADHFGKPVFKPFPRFENRHPNALPDFSETPLRNWGRSFDDWYNDNHAWRTEMLEACRHIRFAWFDTPIGREVPGVDGWIFRRGDKDWPELDDYLGAFELTDEHIEKWLTLIDGRIEWCAAHGSLYFLVPSPVKAQIRPDKIPYYIRAHRGQSVAAQMREAIAAAPAHIRNHVLFLEDDLAEALAQGREVYFRVDHHLNAYGTWLLYNRLNERIRAFHPELGEMPFYDVPPENVLTNGAFGCYPAQNTKPEDEGGRLHVSAPGEAQRPSGELLAPGPLRYPSCNILTMRPGEGLSVLMSHDSYMRFTLSSWREEPGSVRFPFAPGINRVEAYIFHRITTGFLETAFDRRIHDIVVEQFPEVRLNRNPIGFEFAMKNAALYARAQDWDGKPLPAGSDGVARIIFDNVTAHSTNQVSVVLRQGDEEAGRQPLRPGVRRALWFPLKNLPANPALTVEIENGDASATNLTLRVISEAQ